MFGRSTPFTFHYLTILSNGVALAAKVTEPGRLTNSFLLKEYLNGRLLKVMASSAASEIATAMFSRKAASAANWLAGRSSVPLFVEEVHAHQIGLYVILRHTN